MTTLIEAMAKNICLSLGFNPMERVEAGDTTLWKWECYQPAAQAALTALQESGPTPEMIEAGQNAIPAGHGQAWIHAEDCFRAMLIAAQGEG